MLRGRCHPAGASLFVQPFVDALRPGLAALQRDALVAVLRDHEGAWATLVPDLGTVIGEVPAPPADRDLQRRATYDAVLAALRRLAAARPLVLVIDDLQDAGAATLDLLGYLSRRLDGSRVLLVGAVRSEAVAVVERLGHRVCLVRSARSTPPPSSPSPQQPVCRSQDQVMDRTAGHTLSVVECLRALADGDTGVPASLSAAVLTRVDRLGAEARSVVEAGAVLRRRLDPRLLAGLTELSESERHPPRGRARRAADSSSGAVRSTSSQTTSSRSACTPH